MAEHAQGASGGRGEAEPVDAGPRRVRRVSRRQAGREGRVSRMRRRADTPAAGPSGSEGRAADVAGFGDTVELPRTPSEVPSADEPSGAGPSQPDPGPSQPRIPRPSPQALLGALSSSSMRPMEALTKLLGAVGEAAAALGPDYEDRAAEAVAFLRRRLTGDYEADEFGLDPDFAEHVLLPLLRPLYRTWFRVEVRGVEHIPSTGGALVVGNHSGTVAVDGLMTSLAVHDEHPAHRFLRPLGADLVFSTPFVADLARKSGATLACTEDAHGLLTAGELVGVFPEGIKGIGKPFRERYRLQRFGRGGFVATAVRAGVPIVPVSIVGAEEIFPMIGNLPVLARLIGAPYFPVTPTFPWLGPLGLVPLPSKWIIAFGEPIPTDGIDPEVAEDPMTLFELGDRVREVIQQQLYELLEERGGVFG